MSSGPPLKRGWMKKYSRSGLIKNWQSRYFVLNQGKIAYYQNQSDRFPYGDDFKGELGLFQAVVSTDSKKVVNEKQFYIAGANGEKDLLLEVENAAEVESWLRAINEHVHYADRRGSIIDDNGGIGAVQPSNNSSKSSVGSSRNRLGSVAEFPVTPAPGFVIKVLRTNGEKVFVNLCEAAEIPMMNISIGYSKWPFMVLTPVRSILEDKDGSGNAAEISVYDAIVNPAVLVTCGKNPESKDAVGYHALYNFCFDNKYSYQAIDTKSKQTCARVLRLLKKQYGEDLQEEYKLPKIAKRYKGEIQSVLIPVDVQLLSKTRSSIHVRPARQQSNSTDSQGSMVASLPRQMSTPLPSTPTGLDGKAPATESQSGRAPLNRQNTEPINSSSGSGGTKPPVPPLSRVKSVNMSSNLSGSNFLRRKSETEQSSSLNISSVSTASKLFPPVTDGAPNTNSDFSRNNHINNATNNMNNSNVNSTNGLIASVGNGAPRMVIPYIVVRANGASARVRPEKLSQSKNLGHNTRVYVNARRFMLPEKVAWLRTTDGWITERVYVGSHHRVLQPCGHGQPQRAKIVNTRFEDVGGSNLRSSYSGRNTTVSQSGWFGFRDSAIHEPFQTRFSIDVYFPDNALIRLSRTLAEFLTMRQQLLSFPDKMIQDRANKAGEIYVVSDGDENLVLDVHFLLEVVEGVENWLCKLLSTLPVEKCKCRALVDFLSPKEADMDIMESMLSCKGGLNGAWPEVEIELQNTENSIQE